MITPREFMEKQGWGMHGTAFIESMMSDYAKYCLEQARGEIKILESSLDDRARTIKHLNNCLILAQNSKKELENKLEERERQIK